MFSLTRQLSQPTTHLHRFITPTNSRVRSPPSGRASLVQSPKRRWRSSGAAGLCSAPPRRSRGAPAPTPGLPAKRPGGRSRAPPANPPGSAVSADGTSRGPRVCCLENEGYTDFPSNIGVTKILEESSRVNLAPFTLGVNLPWVTDQTDEKTCLKGLFLHGGLVG